MIHKSYIIWIIVIIYAYVIYIVNIKYCYSVNKQKHV